jgi:hypothetical protein
VVEDGFDRGTADEKRDGGDQAEPAGDLLAAGAGDSPSRSTLIPA